MTDWHDPGHGQPELRHLLYQVDARMAKTEDFSQCPHVKRTTATTPFANTLKGPYYSLKDPLYVH
ncbi:unnamed protein product [Nesidiocoris tenuis]|uniref:Uncharacterized protein n=1 Tax=Nesidiocoris tenuis TaxID=355587 RepID=A0A6H5H9P8_9HEMI|nr:unnamed protein product [Nesidiocoris tenuis]